MIAALGPKPAWATPDDARKAARILAARRRRSARLAPVALDAFGHVRRGSVTVGEAGAVILIRLPFRTFSPSAGSGSKWGGHWSGKAAEVKAWRGRLEAAVNDSTSLANRAAWLAGAQFFPWLASRVDWPAPAGLALVTCRRVVTSAAHLIKDDDNLRFAFKGLIDAVVSAGFLRGDSTREIRRRCRQTIGPVEWTEIEIDARPGAAEGVE